MVEMQAENPKPKSAGAAAMARLRSRRRKAGLTPAEILVTADQKALIKRVAVALGKSEAEVAGMLAAAAARQVLEQVAQLELNLAS